MSQDGHSSVSLNDLVGSEPVQKAGGPRENTTSIVILQYLI